MDRKARLATLRKLKDDAGAEGETSPVKLSFRNYAPLLENEGKVTPVPTAPKELLSTLEDRAKNVEKDTRALLEKQVASSDNVDITSLAPRKPGFDLARELERRTERLEKKLNFAIAENIRQRFKDSNNISEMGAVANDGGVDEDDDD